MFEVFSQQANDLIKQGDYLKGLQVLKTIWKSRKDVHIANQILLCTLQLSSWREGESWIETFKRQYPNDADLKKTIKQFQTEHSLASKVGKGKITSISEETIDNLDSIDDPKRKYDLINQVIFKAKQKGEWETAFVWFKKIEKSGLNVKSKEKSISDLQKYYLNALDIFTAREDFIDLNKSMEEAVKAYPSYFAFVKAYTASLIKLEKFAEAKFYLNTVIDWEKPKWYLVEQLAIVLFHLNETEEAWKLSCRSFNTKIDQKFKTDLHLTMIDIATKLELFDIARDIGILTVLVRTENKETIPEHLFDLIKDADPELTVDRILKRHHDSIQDGIHWGMQRFEGVITYFPLNQNFARLRYGNKKSALINKADLEEDCHYEGAKITFIEKIMIDKKTGKEAVFAKLGRKLHKLETI